MYNKKKIKYKYNEIKGSKEKKNDYEYIYNKLFNFP